jgi:hypothetical protein
VLGIGWSQHLNNSTINTQHIRNIIMKKHIPLLVTILGLAVLFSQAQPGDPVVTLTRWDQGTGELSGTVNGQPFSAIVLSGSSTGIAQESAYGTNVAMRNYAIRWNTLVRNSVTKEFGLVTTGDFSTLLASMTVDHCSVQLSMHRDGTVKSIRPVP